ncbi:TELO2-interacting protein 1 homolog [Linum perenne]
MRGSKYTGSLHVERTRDWLRQTSLHVVKLLSATFPHICVHPVKKLRRGLLAAIKGLISKCSSTLKEGRTMLLECLFVLVVDESEDVAASAQEFLEFLFSSCGKRSVKADIAQIFARIIETLPKVVLGGDESVALFHAQQLLVVIYYSGPQFVLDHLQNPVTAARLLDLFSLCLSQNSLYGGALDKVTLTRTSSICFLPSIMELRCGSVAPSYQDLKDHSPANVDASFIHRKPMEYPLETHGHSYELPRMPPWFVHVGNKKLYDTIAGVLRLVGLSLLTDLNQGYMAVITDIPLGHIHKLVSEICSRDANESWQYWYNRAWSGKLIRQASTSACILNEMIFGISDKAVQGITMVFEKAREKGEGVAETDVRVSSIWPHSFQSTESMASVWKASQQTVNKSHLIDCIGRVLHEYLSSELWNLPIDHGDLVGQKDKEAEVNLHLFQDAAALQQVAIDGIGIFATCLGNDFSSRGFLHSTLYLLLESLVSADIQVRTASDAVLHVLSATCGHSSVGQLVLANADYVVDSICRQLRHLDLNPQVPDVLASMLSYIGVTHKVLPLLEETMDSVSRELEILGRHQHPELTTPFLKAVAEICKASQSEASSLPYNAALYLKDVKSKVSRLEEKVRAESNKGSTSSCDDNVDTWHGESEQWAGIIIKLDESKRYRRTVGSIAGSCLLAATPLLASMDQAACLVALDIVQGGIASLAKVEEAYQHEKETKEVLEEVVREYSIYQLQDTMDATDEGIDENRLLPAMNKIWPFLISCVRNKNPVAVTKCATVIANVVQTCGGDFFTRRFHTDGPCLWKLLSSSPFQRKPLKGERATLRLPYRSSLEEESVAETSNMKVQVAVLNMVAHLAQSKRSCTALEVVLKKVSGLVVGIACSGVSGLHDASVSALDALATMDPDLIWILIADVYYSLKEENGTHPPSSGFLEMSRLLPQPDSPKEYLYVQYGGQSYGFDINLAAVEKVFRKLHSLNFPEQQNL